MGRVAQGRISFERAGARTVVAEARAESPLRFLTPAGRGPGAWGYASTLGGGLLDGDSFSLDVTVRRGARAGLGTQGPTRVFRSPGGCSIALDAQVEEDALLALAPDATACFAGA